MRTPKSGRYLPKNVSGDGWTRLKLPLANRPLDRRNSAPLPKPPPDSRPSLLNKPNSAPLPKRALGNRPLNRAQQRAAAEAAARQASYCGNCALKPTMGALHRGERQGYSQSHVGVHAGSLADMWRVAMEIARRAGGDPGQPGLFGAPELSPALQPARLIVMETAGWAGLDAETREGFDRILAVLGDAGVEVLRSTDDPLIDAFERGIVEAKAITTDSPGTPLAASVAPAIRSSIARPQSSERLP